MLTTKMLEIRDHCTCIPAVAIRMRSDDPIDDRFLWRSGYPCGDPPASGRVPVGLSMTTIVLMRLCDERATTDPYDWDNRTMRAAHVYVEKHFDELRNGQVVDVRVVLGEATESAAPEICA